MNKSTIYFLGNQLKNYVISHKAMGTLHGGSGDGGSGEGEETPPWMYPTADYAGIDGAYKNG
ncbi:hypothetical protein AB9P05_15850 [Roseivirga sp. BDSF3-8]|uniref:hypothetical protein n=1 Tax=Roseivirga sp. BDSF3-8 TaxID=3241598 RepID=UPI003531CCFD